jgi:hypothetical protein
LEEVDGRRQSLVRSSSGPECKKDTPTTLFLRVMLA